MRKKERLRRALKGRHFWNNFATAVGIGAFFQQVTEKDVQAAVISPAWQTYTLIQKGEFIFGRFLNRTIGINPWPSIGGQFPFAINASGWVNKWTGIGAGALGYGLLPFSGLPHKGKVKKTGIALLFAGIIGGILDPPVGSAVQNKPSTSMARPTLATNGYRAGAGW